MSHILKHLYGLEKGNEAGFKEKPDGQETTVPQCGTGTSDEMVFNVYASE
jgi:hypothetical protein